MIGTISPHQHFEQSIAEHLRWQGFTTTAQPSSGAHPYFKGDILAAPFLIECKHTIKDTLRVQWSWWEKIRNQAADRNLLPVLAVGATRDLGVGYSQAYLMLHPLHLTMLGARDLGQGKSIVIRDFTPRSFVWQGELFDLTQCLPKDLTP